MNRQYLAFLLLILGEQEISALLTHNNRAGGNQIISSPQAALLLRTKPLKRKTNVIKHYRKQVVLRSTEASASEDPPLSSSASEIIKLNGSSGNSTNVSIVVDGIPLSTGSSAVEFEETEEVDDRIVPASVAVGAITATLGFLYVRTLGTTQAALWKTVPTMLHGKFGTLNPYFFIPGVMTAGGLLIAAISSNLKTPTFAVYDFVSGFSSTGKVEPLPSSRVHLVPLMILCLLTSSFGFSLGPEAPMVCAGGLTGASLARFFFGKEDPETAHRHQETLAYAGAAGAITASLGVPVAGSIFALEMTRACAGMAKAERVLSPAIIASVAALVLVQGIFTPMAMVGGHFDYGSIGALSGAAMIATAVASGIGGAVLGTGFHKVVSFLKNRLWAGATPGKGFWKRQLLVKGGIGLVVGLLATQYPQTLFWGEGSLQAMIDGQHTAFAATKHGLIAPLTSAAIVNPNVPYASGFAALQIGFAKLVAIALACAGKFPGGIIFPLFSAAPPFAHAFASFLGPGVIPVAVMSLMASLQASVTRTPLATALILSLTASATTELSVMLPACLISSYLGVYVARRLSRKSYFTYKQ
jgi:H+/Cl- antiporter ClcA